VLTNSFKVEFSQTSFFW